MFMSIHKHAFILNEISELELLSEILKSNLRSINSSVKPLCVIKRHQSDTQSLTFVLHVLTANIILSHTQVLTR